MPQGMTIHGSSAPVPTSVPAPMMIPVNGTATLRNASDSAKASSAISGPAQNRFSVMNPRACSTHCSINDGQAPASLQRAFEARESDVEPVQRAGKAQAQEVGSAGPEGGARGQSDIGAVDQLERER